MQTAPKHGRGHSRIGDLSVGIKITILCVGLCAALAIALTAIGYRQASEGLRTQAESALASDAMTVASTVDGWNIQRIRDLQSLSANPVIQEFAAADPVARATQMKQIQGALKSLLDSASDEGLEAVGIMDSAGNFVADTASTLPAPSPQRDYFKAAMNGKAFISGVSISTVTNAASIYHSTPIKGVDGRVIAVLRSRAGLAPLQRAIEAAKSRMGKQSTGVLLDESGLVVASDVDAGWVMRPVIPLKPEILQPLVQEKRWGNNASPDPLGQTDLSGAIGAKKSARFNWKLQGKPFDAMVVPLTQTTWSYVEALPLEVVEAPANSFLQGSAIAALVALLLATFFAVLFARSLASTARHLAEGARHIASGDLDYEIKVSTGDEIGRAALAFKDLAASERALAETAQAVASGDLTRDVVARSESDVLGLAFRRMNASLRDLVGRVQSSVETLACSSTELGTTASQTGAALQETESTIQGMARGSQEQSEATEITSANMVQLSRAIDQIATGSQEQARSIEKTSASVAQLNLSIARVAGASEEVSLATQQARAAAASGADSVGKSVKGMQAVQASTTDVAARIAKLGSNSSQIGVIVETIDDIAEQTNLLALNAAIEAARAGEHGKGFAVVADEVRKLAERSSRSTKDIAALIAEVQKGTSEAVAAVERESKEVEAGSRLAEEAGEALDRTLASVKVAADQASHIASAVLEMETISRQVVALMDSVSAVVAQSAAATEEMAASSQEVEGAMKKMASVSEEASASAKEVTASSQEMGAQVASIADQAQDLARMAEELRTAVSQFKTEDGGSGSTEVVSRRRKSDWAANRPDATVRSAD